MSHAGTQHPNSRLAPRHRRNMVACVLRHGWTIEQIAERLQVDPKTAREWRNRYLTKGDTGLRDRSGRPHHSPNQTPRAQRRRVITDNGSCRRSGLRHQSGGRLGVTERKTRPRLPQTNGTVERFHRILLEEWAYSQVLDLRQSEGERLPEVHPLLPSSSFPRRSRLGHTNGQPDLLAGDNLPAEHTQLDR